MAIRFFEEDLVMIVVALVLLVVLVILLIKVVSKMRRDALQDEVLESFGHKGA